MNFRTFVKKMKEFVLVILGEGEMMIKFKILLNKIKLSGQDIFIWLCKKYL